jgi:putative two-component system response regulator
MQMLDERQREQTPEAAAGSLDELLSAIVGQAQINVVGSVGESAAQHSLPEETSDDLRTSSDDLMASRVMIVDDEPINVKVAKKFVEALGYSDFVTSTDSRNVIESLRQDAPDVLLLDVMMPYVSGLDILDEMQADPTLSRIPVIMLTASVDRRTRIQALNRGATDFLTKPLDPEELRPRLRNSLLMRSYETRLRNHALELEVTVRDRTRELCSSRLELIHCLGRAAEYRDDDTGKHILRVGCFAALIARKAGLPGPYVEMIELAAQLHDVGKIGLTDAVLLKPGRLTDEERTLMQEHAGFGAAVLNAHLQRKTSAIGNPNIGADMLRSSRSPLTKMAASIALTHHEKWDGSGYPNGLTGTDIPIEGRITAIADVFDALRSKRPYKKSFSFDRSFDILIEGRGQHFDPDLLDLFLACRTEIEELDAKLRTD